MTGLFAVSILLPIFGHWGLQPGDLLGALVLPIFIVVIADRRLRRRR